MLYSILSDIVLIVVGNFVLWSIVSYLLTESNDTVFTKYVTRFLVVAILLLLFDTLVDSINAHDYLIDETGLPYNKIIMKVTVILTTLSSMVLHWKSYS